jgi:hypothetical protein
MDKKTLNNSKMGRLVARLFGKSELDVKDGKVSLSDQERQKVLENYGQDFLDKLESINLDEEGDAVTLFNAAVAAKTDEATKALKEQVKKLQKDVVSLASEPEPKPDATAVPASKEAKVFAINMAAAHNKLVKEALDSVNPYAFTAMEDASIDITDLNAEFKMTMPPKMKLELLNKRIYNGFDDAKHMTRIQSNTDYIASAAIMSEVSQQFTPKWTPKGAAKFTPIRIPYRRHKLNVLIQPADVLKSWLLYLYEQGKTMADMPITRYIIENHILPKVLDDITISMIAKGKFIDAGVVADGDAGKAAKNSMDGFETILVEGKSDENCKINYYKAAADPMQMSDSELLAYIDGFVDSISGLFAHIVTIHCSEQLLTRYKRADFAVNGKYTGFENDGSIRFTNFHLVPLKSMYNSPIIFATPKENFVELVDLSKAENCIVKIEEQNYDVKVFGEYSLSTGFKIAEAVYAAVPDGYTPVESIVSDVPDTDKWENGKKAADNTEDQGSETNPDQGQGGA